MMGQVQELEIGKRAFEHAGIGASVAPTNSMRFPIRSLAEGVTVEAAVKWFNATKGYGFVELSDGRGDAFLHLKTLRETGAKLCLPARRFASSLAPAPEARRWCGLLRSTPEAPSTGRRGVRLLTRPPPSI